MKSLSFVFNFLVAWLAASKKGDISLQKNLWALDKGFRVQRARALSEVSRLSSTAS